MPKINIVFIILLSFAAFATIECRKKTTIGELKTALEPLQKQVDLALAGYKKNNHKEFELAVNTFQLSERAETLPDNATMDLENVNEFQELTLRRFVFPILADPVKLSEALKLHGLGVALLQQSDSKLNLTEPHLMTLIETIEKINQEEKKAKYDWNHTNLDLEKLYNDLHESQSTKYIRESQFIVTSGFNEYHAEVVRQFANRNSVKTEVMNAAISLKKLMTKLPEVLPLDSREKIEKAAEFMHEYNHRESSLWNILEKVENIYCGGGKCEFAEVLAHPPEPYAATKDTLPELLAVVEPLRAKLDQAVSGYQRNNYTVFVRIASEFVFSHSLKDRLQKLSLNSTIADSDEAAQTFLELTTYKFLYPILIDPHRLGDALKVNALTREVLKAFPLKNDEDIYVRTPGMQQVKGTISKIIQEEAKNDFNKGNIFLNELYGDLGIQNPETLGLNYEYIKQECRILKEYCDTKASPCRRVHNNGLSSKSSLIDENNEQLNKHYPIDNDGKVFEVIVNLVFLHMNRNIVTEYKAKPHNQALVSIECDVTRCFRRNLNHLSKANDE